MAGEPSMADAAAASSAVATISGKMTVAIAMIAAETAAVRMA
jgi:hypothetical protein